MNFPNYITLFRIFLVPAIFSCLIYYDRIHPKYQMWAVGLFVTAMITDALDGIIARRFKLQTELGRFLDPFADKLLLISCFFAILFSSGLHIKPPLWILIIVVFRDLFIICGLIIIFLTTKHVRIQPNFLGKLTTTLQMLTIFSVLLQWELSFLVWLPMAAATVISGVVYAIRESKRIGQIPIE